MILINLITSIPLIVQILSISFIIQLSASYWLIYLKVDIQLLTPAQTGNRIINVYRYG